MRKILYGLFALWMLLCPVTSSEAQVSIGIGLPNVSIGINLPLFPELTVVPGYPVYYAPRLEANYFFYDGMYWVYQNDYWYASSWYNGPWSLVEPEFVPLFILRIPVRYYRQPPVYFREWQPNAPPRWGQHWGHEWEQRRGGWDRWKRSSAPAPAPLPVYQRQYSGDRYPGRVEQQHKLRSQSYRYQPRDKVIRQHFEQQKMQKAPAPAQQGRQQEPAMRSPRQQDAPRSAPPQQAAPPAPHAQPQPPRQRGEDIQKAAPVQAPPQQRGPAMHEQKQQPGAAQHEQKEQKAPRVKDQEQRQQDRDESQEPHRGHGQGRDKDEERGRGRDK